MSTKQVVAIDAIFQSFQAHHKVLIKLCKLNHTFRTLVSLARKNTANPNAILRS